MCVLFFVDDVIAVVKCRAIINPVITYRADRNIWFQQTNRNADVRYRSEVIKYAQSAWVFFLLCRV